MIDLTSVAVGMIAGGSIGYIAATLRSASRMDDLECDLDNLKRLHGNLHNRYELLYRDYSRLTDRDERGRFVKREGNNK